MPRILRLILMVLCSVAVSQAALAKGGGGHGGGGHSGGGHAGGHGSGGHSASHGHGNATSHATAASPTTTSLAGHARNGQPVVGTAVPRSALPPPAPVTPIVIGPTRISPFVGGFISPWFYYPFSGAAFGSYDSYDLNDAVIDGSEFTPTDPFDGGPSGALRLKVDPDFAQVFVDGYYAGTVHEFDGIFHHLKLQVGLHHVEVRTPAYETLMIDVDIQPHHTTVYRGVLRREN